MPQARSGGAQHLLVQITWGVWARALGMGQSSYRCTQGAKWAISESPNPESLAPNAVIPSPPSHVDAQVATSGAADSECEDEAQAHD